MYCNIHRFRYTRFLSESHVPICQSAIADSGIAVLKYSRHFILHLLILVNRRYGTLSYSMATYWVLQSLTARRDFRSAGRRRVVVVRGCIYVRAVKAGRVYHC